MLLEPFILFYHGRTVSALILCARIKGSNTYTHREAYQGPSLGMLLGFSVTLTMSVSERGFGMVLNKLA
jgi:hypothetical protein